MDTKDVMNSCLMWAMNLDAPVDFGSIFDYDDLKDTGLEFDSHITLLYAQGKELPRKELLGDVKSILGSDFEDFINLCKGDHECGVFTMFDLGMFENDSDYIVLKLKKDSEIFDMVNIINKGLRIKYGVSSDFSEYNPHITLAELQPGTARKYIDSETLKLVLNDSYISFEDLVLSYGTDNDVEDRKQYYLTSFKSIDRFFRIEELKKSDKELRSMLKD